MRLGANGFPFGFDQKLTERWLKIKDDPNQQDKNWKRLDPLFKYLLTQDIQYKPSDLVLSMIVGWHGIWCGNIPYQAKVDGDLLTVDSLTISTPEKVAELQAFIKSGNKIKFKDSDIEYFIVDGQTLELHSGITTNNGFYFLFDSNVNFLDLPIQSGDLIINMATGGVTILGGVSEEHRIPHGEPYNLFLSNQSYKIVRMVFKVSTELNGTPIVFNDNVLQFHPADKVFYHPDGCYSLVSEDDQRDNFLRNALTYLIFSDNMTRNERLIVNDVLMQMVLIQTTLRKINNGDTDNTHFAWIAHTILALALEDEFPELSQTILNNPSYKGWESRIRDIFTNLIGGKFPDNAAYPIQGTGYDPYAITYIIMYRQFLEWYTGHDYFPEIKSKIPSLAEAFKSMFTSEFQSMFEWSDNQSIYTLHGISTINYGAVLADLTNSSEMWYVYDRVVDGSGRSPFNAGTEHSLFNDPYAVRMSKEEFLEKNKNISHNDTNRGITIFHTGYDKNDSSILINDWNSNRGDHDPDSGDRGIMRKGQLALDWARGYYSNYFWTANNDLSPFGAFSLLNYQGRTRREYYQGSDWVYTSATRKSLPHPDHHFYNGTHGGAGNIKEQTRKTFYIRLPNNADLMLDFYILDTPTGEGVSTRTSLSGYTFPNVPNAILGFEQAPDRWPLMGHVSQWKHQINYHLPTVNVIQGLNSWTWVANQITEKLYSPGSPPLDPNNDPTYTAGTELVTLNTFIDDYEAGVYFNNNPEKDELGYPIIDTGSVTHGSIGASLRIRPKEQFGRFNWLNSIYARSHGDVVPDYEKIENGLKVTLENKVYEVKFLPEFSFSIDGVRQLANIINSTPQDDDPEPPVEPPEPPVVNIIKGMYDGILDEEIYGWSYNTLNSSESNRVDIFIDGTKVDSSLTDQLRSDINMSYGIIGLHGYKFPIPNIYKDGIEHMIKIEAFDMKNEKKTMLNSSGASMKFIINPPEPEPPAEEPPTEEPSEDKKGLSVPLIITIVFVVISVIGIVITIIK